MNYSYEEIKKSIERKQKRRKLLTNIIYIILIPILMYNILLIVKTMINSNETPSMFGYKTYIIISGSMEPKIKIGDVVIVKNVNQEDLKENDVISFRQGQNIVTHRIIKIIETDMEKKYKTKGDNNNAEDSWTVTYNNIEGKMVCVFPKIGKVAMLLQNVFVIISISIIIFVYIVHTNNVERKKAIRSMKRMKYESKKGRDLGEK